ncbi:hypothetical protein ACERII_13840 [Evansella sp. AB-rgal1]|uniref:hypothetical protein n=1 Tax=Evansella sp. AB-rgal1 TaxID=3242696 RepID=UPI00359D87F4
MNSFLTISIICTLASPLLFFHQRLRTLALMNTTVVITLFIVWISLIAGWLTGNGWSITWYIAQIFSVLFLIVGLSRLFWRLSRSNKYILAALVVLVAGGSLLISGISLVSLRGVSIYLFFYFAPIFVLVISIIGVSQYFNRTYA